MNTLRWHRFWFGLWLLGMLLGVYLSLYPSGAEMPSLSASDKLIHAGGYAALALFAVCLYERPAPRWRALAWVVALGGLIEIAQGLLPTGRTMEVADFAANLIGTTIAAALFWRRNVLRGIERMVSGP